MVKIEMKKWDFSGWATRNNLQCSDGRTILRNAFKDNDGQIVPLVWNHQHNDSMNVLGHALLENREEGMYAYGTFNDTEAGRNAKLLVQHGDVSALSIYANRLKQRGGAVLHGAIREVSLVLSGANPGAFIDTVLQHGEESDDEAVIYTGEDIELFHAENYDPEEEDYEMYEDYEDGYEDVEVEDIIDSMTEEQQDVMYALIGQALEEGEMSHSDGYDDYDEDYDDYDEDYDDATIGDVIDTMSDEQQAAMYAVIGQTLADAEEDYFEGGNESMKHNVFDQDYIYEDDFLSHSEMCTIIDAAKSAGGSSLKDTFFAHFDTDEEALAHSVTNDDGSVQTYGMSNMDYLFPDAKYVSNVPDFIKRDTNWVTKFMKDSKHLPFSRVKTLHADITMDEARAKGYIKGNQKSNEVFALLKRSTTPTTIYKKQKLDRDDMVDIVDFDVVAWLKAEMRLMLDEEIARAALVGDGRLDGTDDKINESNIRPIWKDESLYTIKKSFTPAAGATDQDKAKEFIKQCIKARKDYKGSGNPVLFTTEDMLTDMLMIEDGNGRDIYDSIEKLKTKLRVSDIVTVEVMENLTRAGSGSDAGKTFTLLGICVNPIDYGFGADKGGSINMFDDFDIDFNRQKYLIETRCSGALLKPYSAVVVETKTDTVAG